MYYVFLTTAKFTKITADRINRKIKTIDKTAEFIGLLSIPGNNTTGWIERPNDGTNNYNHVRSRNNKIVDIAIEELAGPT